MMHPVLVVSAVAERNRLTSVMQCLLALVVAVDRQDQPSVVLPRHISPFVLQIVVAPVVALARNSAPAPALRSAPAVFLILLVVFLLFHLRTLQSVPLRGLPVPVPFRIVVVFMKSLHPDMDSCTAGILPGLQSAPLDRTAVWPCWQNPVLDLRMV